MRGHMKTGAVVLCGGKSTRMGSSKALLPFGPETMLQRVVRLLADVVSPIVVVAAVDQPLPMLPPEVIITRDELEGRGPLEGLRAGLKALPTDIETAYVTSCDVPLLEPAFVREMLRHRGDGDRRLPSPAVGRVSPDGAAACRGSAGSQPAPTGISFRKSVVQG